MLGAMAAAMMFDAVLSWKLDTRADTASSWFLTFAGGIWLIGVLIITFARKSPHERTF